jgi:hypothetical protein
VGAPEVEDAAAGGEGIVLSGAIHDARRLRTAAVCWMARQMAGTSSSKQQSIAPASMALVHISSSGVWWVQIISMPN